MKNQIRNIPKRDPADFYVWTAFGVIAAAVSCFVLMKECPLKDPINKLPAEKAKTEYVFKTNAREILSLKYFQLYNSVEEFRKYINPPEIFPLEDKLIR